MRRQSTNHDDSPLLVNAVRQRRAWVRELFVWYRNPLFFASVAVAALGAAGGVLHGVWGFTSGCTVALAAVVAGAWVAGATVDHHRRVPRTLSSWQKAKAVYFVCFWACAFGGLVWLQARQLGVFLAPGAGDPQWAAFPGACRATPPFAPPLNCVRAGPGVPKATAALGQPPIAVPRARARLAAAVDALVGIVGQHADFHDCHLLTHRRTGAGTPAAAHFLHWRCLSLVLGYPDDVAARVDCDADGTARFWLHSQSRLRRAEWDHGVNDARVRLITQYMQLPRAADWFPWAAMLRSNESCDA